MTVAATGGDYTLVSDALAAIGDGVSGLPAATAAAPYVIQVAPGTYVEPGRIVLKNHVDIVGSGRRVTVITSGWGTPDYGMAGAWYASNVVTEIRDLTVENTGGGNVSVVVVMSNGADVTAINVTARASGGAEDNTAFYVPNGTLQLDRVNTSASGGSNANRGVQVSSGGLTIRDSTIAGAGDGLYTNAPAVVLHSELSGTNSAVNLSTVDIAHSMLDGTFLGTTGATCIGAYDGSFVGLDTDCTPVAP